MTATLLTLRLLLQESTADAVGEPTLFVESTRVAAVWECGCVAAGRSYDVLAFVECRLHERALERHSLSGPTSTAPSRPKRLSRAHGRFAVPRAHARVMGSPP